MNLKRPKIVAVDGPAGSGKSSLCQKIAKKIGWSYVNTGALYRAVGYLAWRRQIDLHNETALGQLVDEVSQFFSWQDDTGELFYKDENLSPFLHSESAGNSASIIAKQRDMRTRLLPVQRQLALASLTGVFVDGRDIGTVVFPDADLKIFLTASLEERARRRLMQLGSTPSQAELEKIKDGIAQRDLQDEKRGVAPLKKADDAVVIDTSQIDFEQTIAVFIDLLQEKQLIS